MADIVPHLANRVAVTREMPHDTTSDTLRDTAPDMTIRMACQDILSTLLQDAHATRFASLATVDGRSFAHASSSLSTTDAQRSAAITSSLMGLIESFSRESLDCGARYNSIATDKGSIVIVRVPSRARLHTLCVCADASANLAMTIRAALDTAQKLAERLDAPR